ncbi:c-type cytochrome [Novosphingobium aquimarinum]|uniref:c-type cytochrome n=1 Tax=Novosphingobium aquimarinum TaxID=2682494 RepID=UPI0012ECAC16|nr:c-type cytochrome [Novosphingobium aquimarinum]
MNLRLLPVILPAVFLLQACGGEPASESTSPDTATEPTPSAGSPSKATPTPVAIAAAGTPPAEFAVCRACHSVEPGKNGIGPSLHGIVGEKAGAVPGYAFSAPLKASGIVWNRATLDQWLTNPMKMVPGTRMALPVSDPAKRKAIIDYLVTLK